MEDLTRSFTPRTWHRCATLGYDPRMDRGRRLHRAVAVKTVREARELIPAYLDEVRKGTDPEPEIFGAHRKPEGVILSYPAYLEVLEELEDLTIARIVAERDASRGERFIELDDAMRSLGFDPDEHDAG